MIRLDTLQALHEHDHKLAAYCATCERWEVLDLARLITEGRRDYCFVDVSRAAATAAGRANGSSGRQHSDLGLAAERTSRHPPVPRPNHVD